MSTGPGGLPVPDGDPAELRSFAAALDRTATLVASAADTIGSEGSQVVSSAGWTGPAADAFTGRCGRLKTRCDSIEAPLQAMAAAARTYADALEQAQKAAMAANAVAVASHHLPPEDAGAARTGAQRDAALATSAASSAAGVAATAVRGATGRLPDRKEAPPEPRTAEAAEDEAPSLLEWVDETNRKLGWFVSPVAAGLSARETQVWGAAAVDWVAGPAATEAQLFSDIVSRAGLAFDRGEISLAELGAQYDRYKNAEDAVEGFRRVFSPSWYGTLREGGLPAEGVLATAGRLFAGVGVFSDVLTLANPGVDNPVEAGMDRTAAGLNLVGSAGIIAGSEATTAVAATILGTEAAAVGWVPVAGQVVVAVTGLVLAADWAYNNVGWFHDGVDAAGHAIATGAEDAGKAVATAAVDSAKAVAGAAEDTFHAAETVTSGAVHTAESVVHDLNPFHW